jgi:hypothetical protein
MSEQDSGKLAIELITDAFDRIKGLEEQNERLNEWLIEARESRDWWAEEARKQNDTSVGAGLIILFMMSAVLILVLFC